MRKPGKWDETIHEVKFYVDGKKSGKWDGQCAMIKEEDDENTCM